MKMVNEIIDTHIHIWDLEKIRYSWLDGNKSILNRSYSIGELEPARKAAGVTGGIFVQAANNLEDSGYMLKTCESTPWMKGAVCWLPLTDPVSAEKILFEVFKPNPYFKGVRHLIHDEPDAQWMLQPNVLESLKMLAQNNIPYDIVGVLPEHIETALKVADKIPDLKMVFDHMNQPPMVKGERFGRWGELMKKASAHPMFYVKISGLGTVTKKAVGAWGIDDLKPYVEFVLHHFGEDRALLGGDWPVSLLAGPYEGTWRIYHLLLQQILPEQAQRKICASNAKKFYHLE